MKANFKGKNIGADRLCIRDGDNGGREEYAGHWFMTSSTNRVPVVMRANKDEVFDEESNPIYAGCYVNAKVKLWAQNNTDGGKRVNAELVAIQFAKDGERIGGSAPVSREDAMDGFDEADEDDDIFAAA
jgi:hypothetical protein